MFGAGAETHAVWAYIVANATDASGTVELNVQIVGACIGMSPESVQVVIDRFCEPDPKSRSKTMDGRKLIKQGEYSYSIVNYEKYRAIKNEAARRESNREAQRRYRAKRKGKPLKGEPEYVKAVEQHGQEKADAMLDAGQIKGVPDMK